MITMTRAEWEAEGTRRFGPDKMTWRFVCPSCGFPQTAQDYKNVDAPEGAVAFSCVGRWLVSKVREAFGEKGGGPCNYVGGGLFRLNPVNVDGHTIFAFEDKAVTP